MTVMAHSLRKFLRLFEVYFSVSALSGVACGKRWGVAKKATLIAVKVANKPNQFAILRDEFP